MAFSKVFSVNGVDHLIAFSIRHDLNGAGETLNSGWSLYACQDGYVINGSETYWTNFTYDPTLAALYTGPPANDVTPGISLNPAAYIVPVVVIGIGLIVAGVAILWLRAGRTCAPTRYNIEEESRSTI